VINPICLFGQVSFTFVELGLVLSIIIHIGFLIFIVINFFALYDYFLVLFIDLN
jgi:hypothetical protein